MLILQRRPDESIVICLPNGELVYVTVLGVRGHSARIGVTAPRGIAVHREEVYERIRLETAAAPG